MTRRMRALPALLALATAACSGDDGGSRGVGVFPLTPSAVTQAANCAGVQTVPPPPLVGGVLEAGTMTTISQAGTYGLSPAGVPLRLSLTGSGEYRVVTWEGNAVGATSSTFLGSGIADGTTVRQWTVQAPGSVTLTPTPGGSFTVVVCTA